MLPRQASSFENAPSQRADAPSPQGGHTPVSLPDSDFIIVDSPYGDNVTRVIRKDKTNSPHVPEPTQQMDYSNALFQPLESLQEPEPQVNTKKRPSISTTNRLVGVSRFLKKLGTEIRDAVFPGLDSDREVEYSILRGKDGMPELEYKRLYAILTSPESKISKERQLELLARTKVLREKQIAKENSYSQTESTFEETLPSIPTPANETASHVESIEHIDIFSATPSPETNAYTVPVNLPVLTEVVHETTHEGEKNVQQAPLTKKASTTLKGKFTNATNRLKGFFGVRQNVKKENTPKLSDDEVDKHYLDHEAALGEINSLYTSARSRMERGTTKSVEIETILSEKATSPEQREKWEKKFEKLRNIQKKTNTIFKETLEKVGPNGKKLVTLLTAGSEYLNTQVNNKAVRLFAAAGLISAGALAAYATPVVLASMAGVGFGLRIVSAAKVYTSARTILDAKYEEWEKEGKKIHALKIVGLEIGAAGAAIFAGDVIGKIFEGIASLDIVREVATSIKNTANIESVTEAWSKLFTKETPLPVSAPEYSITPTPSTAPTGIPDTATANTQQMTSNTLESMATPDPSLIHTVVKGDSLWSLLRGDLSRLNFDGFNGLTQGDQEKMIQKFVDKVDVPSGSKDLIRIKETLDFNTYFKK